MNTATHDVLRPREQTGVRGLGLSLAAHALLVGVIAFGLNWRSHEPEVVAAELWAAVPTAAAPLAATPDAPTPTPTPPAPPPPRPTPSPSPSVDDTPDRDADIAVERKRKDDQRKGAQQKEAQARKLADAREQADADAEARKKLQDKQRQEAQQAKADDARLAAQREATLRRLMTQAGGAQGETGGSGTAAQSAAPSASYGGRVKARVKPNLIYTDTVDGNPQAEVEVRTAPDGTIVGRKLLKSSGVKQFDDAVLQALDKTEVLPRDVDGRVPSPIIISFRPRE